MTEEPSEGALRVYDGLRTAHLERLQCRQLGSLYYRKTSYDFDEDLARRMGARRLGRLGILAGVIRSRFAVVHVNEPLDMYCWPTTLVVYLGVVIRRFVLRQPAMVVTYAIENKDLERALAFRFPRLPRALVRAAAISVPYLLVRFSDRIAFGTPAALENYRRLPGNPLKRVCNTLIVGTATVCKACDAEKKRAGSVVFLGAFDERKGVIPFMEAVESINADLRVEVLGKGPLVDRVLEMSTGDSRICVRQDPDRATIHDVLASTRVLVLPSVSTGEWVEQIGLPIVEGLAHGCVIVTTRETGLSPWLEEHGHVVINSASRTELAAAILAALQTSKAPSEVLMDLPEKDPRLAADDWLEATPWM
ncbi:glycosyltransferase [Aeromicrobium sp. 636]|uniref:Glycosyltransferase n=1 Tax=Aeromicrobium senzhongii TaxID=2663859 RepID=A0A8I0K2S5_9ACTN|nr:MULTISPECIES: glycosyltransferase [Aeromicrobium]MBC9226839.1 glycosyltransferase [Aeromicrobium senzhongii]MCQ3998939.1 glycosyltransferase [Aeromicrobium sp. 636]